MSTVAMARMTSDADRIQDDPTVTPTTTSSSNAAGQKQPSHNTTEKETENNNNNNAGTRKSDSGVYFAMMLSEYLDKNANELPSDHLAAIAESPKRSSKSSITESEGAVIVGQDQQNSNTASSFSSSPQPRLLAPTTGTTTVIKEDDHSSEVPAAATAAAAAAAANDAMANLSNLIWVPAHKHPQIAPSEFVNWIQVHGAAPTRKGSKVKRQKSQLSRSMSYNDALEDFDKDTSTDSTTSESDSPVSPQDTDARLLPGIAEHADGKEGHVFDRHSTVVDDSRILAPPTQNRSLLRRSAFSARRAPGEGGGGGGGRGGIGDRRRSRRPAPAPRHSTDTSERMGHVPSAEPISLHDHPVSMSEWIDLGSASLEPDDSQHGILSRVHDAESQLFSKIMDEDRRHPMKEVENKETTTSEGMTTIPETDTAEERAQVQQESDTTAASTTTTAATTTATTTLSTTSEGPAPDVSVESNTAALTTLTDERRVTLRRSASDLVMNEKVERKPSWISNLLNGDKKKKKNRRGSLRRVDDARHISEKERDTLQLTRVNSMHDGTDNKKRGFAAFISRSLSLKSITTRKEPKFNQATARAKALVAGSQQQNGMNGGPQQQQQPLVTKQYINSYRLPIHVERAVYRLSHMKLANPRRPLRQQVLISEFMFWYLSIINPQPPQHHHQQQGEGNQNTTTSNTQWSSQQTQQHHQQQQQYYQQGEANEAAAALMNSRTAARPPKISAERRFSDDSVAVPRRSSQSSSDEEDNVPLSHYRK